MHFAQINTKKSTSININKLQNTILTEKGKLQQDMYNIIDIIIKPNIEVSAIHVFR